MNSLNMTMLLFFLLCATTFTIDGRAIRQKHYGYQLRRRLAIHPNKIISDGQGPRDPDRGKAVLADMLCQFCRLTNNLTCIKRFCNEGTKIVIGKPDVQPPTIPILADALCQFCIKTNNITCIERFCNEISVQVPDLQPVRLLPIKTKGIYRPSKFLKRRNMLRRSLHGADVGTSSVSSIFADIQCQMCIDQNDSTCIERHCNDSTMKDHRDLTDLKSLFEV